MQPNRRLLLNFLPIKSGGGLQNSLSFLSLMNNDLELRKEVLVLTYKESKIYDFCEKNGFKTQIVKDSLFSRLIFELFSVRVHLNSKTVVFTLFGPPLLAKNGSTSINGCAYSNLFYPEIDFWGFLSFRRRTIKYIIDFYRKKSLTKADVIIFETKALIARASKDSSFKNKILRLVEMAPSDLVCEANVNLDVIDRYKNNFNSSFINLLFLSGAHPNKRHYLWANIIQSLKLKGLNFCLVTTLPYGDYADSLKNKFDCLGIVDNLVNIGPVEPENVASLISLSDGVTNTALLESFSNNFVEAWEMGKPLIVTDADWSRGCCGDGAVFITPTNPDDASEILKYLFESDHQLKQILSDGKNQLLSLPSKKSRFSLFKNIIMENLK